MKVRLKCHYGSFEHGKEYELREVYAKQLISEGVAAEVKPFRRSVEDIEITDKDFTEPADRFKGAFAGNKGLVIKAATEDQRHSLIVKFSELSDEIREAEKSLDIVSQSET